MRLYQLWNFHFKSKVVTALSRIEIYMSSILLLDISITFENCAKWCDIRALAPTLKFHDLVFPRAVVSAEPLRSTGPNRNRYVEKFNFKSRSSLTFWIPVRSWSIATVLWFLLPVKWRALWMAAGACNFFFTSISVSYYRVSRSCVTDARFTMDEKKKKKAKQETGTTGM